MTKETLDHLIDLATKEPGLQNLRPVIGKEILHYDIFNILNDGGYLKYLTFHGGTALRLIHGSARYSEDLDFAGGAEFKPDDISGMAELIQADLSKHYDVPVNVKEPKENDNQVKTWQITVVTHPESKSLPAQRIKIDIEKTKPWTREPRSLLRNYDFLPAGLLVPTMSKSEIMASKLVALPASMARDNIRFRDIWDLAWLHQTNTKPLGEAIGSRIKDNGIEDYASIVDDCISKLTEKVSSNEFAQTMRRFIPQTTIEKSIEHPNFSDYIVLNLTEMLENAKTLVADLEKSQTQRKEPDGPSFGI